jgi:hypothetical protein
MSDLNIQERQIGDVTVLDMDGNVRIGSSNVTLEKAIQGLIAEGRNQVLIRVDSANSFPPMSLWATRVGK